MAKLVLLTGLIGSGKIYSCKYKYVNIWKYKK